MASLSYDYLPPELQAFDPYTYRGPEFVNPSQVLPPGRDPFISAGTAAGRDAIRNQKSYAATPTPYEPGYAQSQLQQSPQQAPSQGYGDVASNILDAYNAWPGSGAAAGATNAATGIGGIGPVASGAQYGASLGGSFGPVASGADYAASLAGANSAAAGAAPGFAAIAGPAALAAAIAGSAYLGYKGFKEGNKGKAALGVGLLTGGLGAPLGLLAHKPATEVEDKRWRKLQEQGVRGFESEFTPVKGKSPGYREDLGADFIGNAPDSGAWTNNPFAKTRAVGSLRPEDIWGYSAFGERYGNDWGTTSEGARRAIAQEALNRGLVKEHHGTIDLKDDEGFDQFARESFSGRTPAASPSPQIGKPLDTTKPLNMGGIINARYAPGATPANTRMDAAGPPPKGTRISPGVYADGRGGSMNMIPRAAGRR